MSGNDTKKFPASWLIDPGWRPEDHMMNLKGRDYLNVQNRLLWFIRDQRDFIAQGLATTSYVIRTELVEQDRQAGYAHFKTYVRDVLGNEATMYGSEAAKDFPDYAEKASTKSLGRALLALGYGTAAAPEMDEGERVVDSPVTPAFVAKPPTLKPAQPQQPTASATDDPMSLTRASALDQKRLYGQLAARNLHTNGGFLRHVIGRNIVMDELRDGHSNLSLIELAKANEQLTRIPVPTQKAEVTR